ncbi:MAG: ABC transporter ATP-binding protein [Verrucomicrobiales bacterium]|nr:ABC transporter ATP-binding protein [Verrucomicrobiales bacterium]
MLNRKEAASMNPVPSRDSTVDAPSSRRSATGTWVRFDSVRKVFNSGHQPVVAVDNVELEIRGGEFFTLLGPSGCGKTTLLRMLGGFESPTSGRIFLGSEDVTDLPPHRRPVNTVFQNYALFPHRTAAGNIAFGLEMLGRPRSEIDAVVGRLLALVQMEGLGDRRIAELSGGQQQRVALARALAPEPKVLLLDEPLSALDAKLRRDMRSELRRLKEATGLTFVFVTHDQEEALAMSDRIGVMHQGRLLQVGTPSEIYEQPSSRFVAQFVGETNFLEAELLELRGKVGVVRWGRGKVREIALTGSGWNLGKVTLAVRPEFARVDAHLAEADSRGTVESVEYLGTATQVRVRFADGTSFLARLPVDQRMANGWTVGTAVDVALVPAGVRVLKE